MQRLADLHKLTTAQPDLRSMARAVTPWLALLALVLIPCLAGASLQGEPRPDLIAIHDGRETALPSLKLDMRARIQGDLASVTLSQTFQNTYDTPIHARYVFPLPPNAAVHAMRFIVGDRMIEAEIREKQEARAVFEAAKTRGQQAALVEQQRPNVFTQEVANLMPGHVIRVELEYAHVIEKQHDDYRFHFPTVVGPRFLPPARSGGTAGAPTRAHGEPESLAVGVWSLPASAPVAPPSRVDAERLSIHVELEAGVAIRSVDSPSHGIETEKRGKRKRVIDLSSARTLDNQDFELHYRLADDELAAGLTTYSDGRDGYLSLLFEPPLAVADADITRREMVFVLDCSGSMSGVPLAASKRFMRRTLANLRPGDSFRIIRFSDSATAWSEAPMPASEANVRDGIRYVDELYGGGGTHMASGIRAALAPPVPEGSLRLVVFLTDGYIGNDIEIVRLLESQRGEARLFAFGIGNSVNRYLIEEMGRPNADAETAADELVARLDAPVLTDIEIDWDGAAVRDVFPTEIPDLFLGETLRVMARYDAPGQHRALIHGRVAGERVTLPVDLQLPARADEMAGAALPIVWARAQIEDRMISFISPSVNQQERDAIQAEVTDLGLEHRLLTRWTSFVAVAREVVNPGGRAVRADVEVPKVKDVSDAAYPEDALPHGSPGAVARAASGTVTSVQGMAPATPAPQLIAHSGFTGRSGPEPSTWSALIALSLVGGVLWWRRAGAHS